jgi:glycosyltransferase involved in cell wall biosynthesis
MDGMTTPSPSPTPPPDEAPGPARDPRGPVDPPDVEIVVPVYNEAGVLEASVRKLHAYVSRECDFSFRITIADNASTDGTLELARSLGRELPDVRVLHFARKGRGLALRAAWGRSDAAVVAYTDVDLSTDLAALPALVGPLLDGRGDLAIGSRLATGAQVSRSVKREVISRTYNMLLRGLLGVGFSDAQCGFKAGRREVVQALLPWVENDRWFFDTELLYLAQRNKFSIREVPVRWTEDPDSRVAIVSTVREDLGGIARLRRRGGQTPPVGLELRVLGGPASSDRHGRQAAPQRSAGRPRQVRRLSQTSHVGRPSS